MSIPENAVDPLERACALVGRFQYHFGLEQKIDEAVIKLLDLDEKAGQIVIGSLDFFKKTNLVRTSALQQLVDERDKEFAEDTCTGLAKSIQRGRMLFTHPSSLPEAVYNF